MNVNVDIKDLKSRVITIPAKDDKGVKMVPLLITAVIGLLMFWVFLPAINPKSVGFWFLLLFLIVVYTAVKLTWAAARHRNASVSLAAKAFGLILAFCVVIGFMTSAKILHAKAYSRILEVTDDSIDIIPSVDASDSIALMDTASAQMLGDRRIGSLTQVVSQFNVGSYIQINYQDAPAKVAALRYDGFFKWMANHNEGVPGYVLVNPVDMSADYIPLEKKMKYVPSAYFMENLERRIRFRYPFAMFGNVHFEIDEEGNPWYVASVYDHAVGLFGGETVIGAILADPVTGTIEKVDTANVPVWADVVFPGDLICSQYNNHAQLQHGFFNSIFAQTDCRQITTMPSGDDEDGYYPDYGYVAKDGDIWIYTGVTSVNGDSSNLGFILANERTSETKFVTVAGADEFSGMRSAEGEVQEKRYTASFPSLINVDGTPTYIMVLKDASGLVRMYAAVNVEQYNIVSTAATQAECIEKYRRLLGQEGVTEEDISSYKEVKVTVKKLEKIDIDGNTWLYIVASDGSIYSAKYADVLGMLTVSEGDTVTILTDGERYRLK